MPYQPCSCGGHFTITRTYEGFDHVEIKVFTCGKCGKVIKIPKVPE